MLDAPEKPRIAASLPDPKVPYGPYRPFASDPGWGEAWWWLGAPAATAIFIIASYWISRDFYMNWVLPEGYGVLEVGHFFIPLAAAVIAFRLLFKPWVRARKLVFAYLLLGGLGCLYIAGEEHSWGQHFFYWDTPEYWAAINRQDETNLHNVSTWLNHKPRAALQAGIIVGGLLIPIVAAFWPWVRRNRWSLFLPAAVLLPTTFGYLLFKFTGQLNKHFGILVVQRPSEPTETFIYLFLLFYLIVFARRVGELEAAESVGRATAKSPLRGAGAPA
jgi:hypothetical protein